MRSILRKAGYFYSFLLIVFCFTTPALTDSITEKRGRFFCPQSGKLLVNVNAPGHKIICMVGDKVYNAVDGSLIQDNAQPAAGNVKIGVGAPPAAASLSATPGRKQKKTTIVNNYYQGDDGGENEQANNNKQSDVKKYPVIKKSRPVTFTGFFVGAFYGYLHNSLNQSNILYQTNSFTGQKYTVEAQSLQSEFANHAFGFLGGFNFQPHSNVMLGIEAGGYVVGEGSFRIPASAYGNYVASIRDLAFVMARIGAVIAKSFNVYVGAGFGASTINEEFLPRSSGAPIPGAWNPESYTRIYPKVMGGFEWLAFGHLSIRLQYEISIFTESLAYFSDQVANNRPERYFRYDGLRHEFKVIASYKF